MVNIKETELRKKNDEITSLRTKLELEQDQRREGVGRGGRGGGYGRSRHQGVHDRPQGGDGRRNVPPDDYDYKDYVKDRLLVRTTIVVNVHTTIILNTDLPGVELSRVHQD